MKEKIIELKNNVQNTRNIFNEINGQYDIAVAEYDAKLKTLRDEFEADNADLIDAFKRSKLTNEVAEDALREVLIANYVLTNDKTFDKDLSVRVTTCVKFPTQEALDWCKTNAPFLVKEVLDTKGFEPIAKSNADKFDFVQIEEKVTAVFAKKFK